MPAIQWYKVRLYRIKAHEIAIFCGEDFYSNPGNHLLDSRLLHNCFTDLVLFAGGCWARRQLSNGIRYICIASEHRMSLSSMERIFIVTLVSFYSTAEHMTTV